MNSPFIVGIAGGSGSGKTTLTNELLKKISVPCSVLCHDYYYKPFYEMEFEERIKQNYDHPDTYDTPLLVSHLKRLKEGKSIERPVYSFEEFTRYPETVTVEPTEIILVEGILLFENKELRDMFDLKVYIDADADIRFIRRLLRDMNERARTVDSVVNQYQKTVKPMHDRYVRPSMQYADIIINDGVFDESTLDAIIKAINEKIVR